MEKKIFDTCFDVVTNNGFNGTIRAIEGTSIHTIVAMVKMQFKKLQVSGKYVSTANLEYGKDFNLIPTIKVEHCSQKLDY